MFDLNESLENAGWGGNGGNGGGDGIDEDAVLSSLLLLLFVIKLNFILGLELVDDLSWSLLDDVDVDDSVESMPPADDDEDDDDDDDEVLWGCFLLIKQMNSL